MSTDTARSTDLRTGATGSLSLRAAVRWPVLAVGVVLAAVPFLWMIFGSFRSEADLFNNPAGLFPTQWTLHGYTAIWQELPFLRLLFNTFAFAGVTTVLCLLFDSMCAYALARIKFRGSTVAFWLVIATLMIPFQVTLIPVFIELFHFGWLDTYQGLILPRATSAFGIFMLRQFFLSIPRELDEAARMDGAGHFRIYWRIILPLAKPAGHPGGAALHEPVERPAVATGRHQFDGHADPPRGSHPVRRAARHRPRRPVGRCDHLAAAAGRGILPGAAVLRHAASPRQDSNDQPPAFDPDSFSWLLGIEDTCVYPADGGAPWMSTSSPDTQPAGVPI